MDTKQIEYIIKIADERNITKAAEKLFITQSALSQQLLKLERELNTPLFVRNKAEWQPTPEGEIYLKNAREMLRIKQRTYTTISDMVNSKTGYLTVGLTPGRGPDMFTHVYPLFHDKYPEVTVTPMELSVRRQQAMIRRGELDIGFMTLCNSQKTGDAYLDLFREELFLAVPDICAQALNLPEATAEDEYPVLSVDAVRYEPFVLMYRQSTVREMIDQIFREAGFSPSVLFETSSNATVLSMIESRLCCGIIPAHYVSKKSTGYPQAGLAQDPMPKKEGMRFFRMPSHPTWQITVSYQKNAYLSKAAKQFIRLAMDFWKQEPQLTALCQFK